MSSLDMKNSRPYSGREKFTNFLKHLFLFQGGTFTPRLKKQAPNRKDGLYEVNVTIGKRLDGSLIRKSFYSSTSKDEARRQAERYKIEQAVAEQADVAFAERTTKFNDWAEKWLTANKLGKVKGSITAHVWVRCRTILSLTLAPLCWITLSRWIFKLFSTKRKDMFP